ncbi:MAG: hypothetical protein ABFD04_11560 [Syntrophomonas sp.]
MEKCLICGQEIPLDMACLNTKDGSVCLSHEGALRKKAAALVRVYTIHHVYMGTGWTTQFPEDFVEDLREELNEQDEEAGYTDEQIMPFLEGLKNLKVEESGSLGNWTITCKEMTQEAFDNMPEFEGW